jgi:hypothetical protein
MTASWRTSHTQPVTPQSSLIEFVRQWRPESRPVNVRLPSLSIVDPDRAMATIELRSSSRARELGDDRPLLALTRVPAGQYEVVVDGPRELAGNLMVSIGPTSQTIEQWPLDHVHAGDTGLRVRLPSLVHSLTIRGDERAKALIRHVGLRPAHVLRDDALNRQDALRAARYGATRAFFLDDAMYMEPAGVWTRGNASAEVVLANDDEGLVDVDLTAGPVPVTLEFRGSTSVPALTLAPGEHRRIQLTNGSWTVTTHGMFRPKDYEPANRDARPLGARIEFP